MNKKQLCFLLMLCLMLVGGFLQETNLQQMVATAQKLPAPIAAMFPEEVRITSHSYGQDPMEKSFVLVEVYAEYPNSVYSSEMSNEARIHLKFQAYDLNKMLGKYTYEQAVLPFKDQKYDEILEEMRTIENSRMNLKGQFTLQEKNVPGGKAIVVKEFFPYDPSPEMGHPEWTYFTCKYLVFLDNIHFLLEVFDLAGSPNKADLWFQQVLDKAKTIKYQELL